jgi:hypothetical protein
MPGTAGGGTNPEQLFAAGSSACYLSAIKLMVGPAGAGYTLAPAGSGAQGVSIFACHAWQYRSQNELGLSPIGLPTGGPILTPADPPASAGR